MMTEPIHDDPILKSWNDYTQKGNLEEHNVREDIEKSWDRCYKSKVNPYDDQRHISLQDEALQKELARKNRLIEVAHPFMTNLYKFVKGTGFVVVLANEHGYILEMFGDEDVLQNPMTKNFFLGASWREEVAGTNAIGTAVVIGEPVQVSGAEHYCSKHHCLTCSAAPILDEKGKLLGVIDISGSYRSSHVHTLGMAVAAAEAIMAQLRTENINNRLAAANRKLMNFFNMVSEGVLILDSQGQVTEMNPAAERIIGRKKHEMICSKAAELISFRTQESKNRFLPGERYADIEATVDTRSGPCSCLVSGEPAFDEGDQAIGSFVTLRPVQQVQKWVNRFSGYAATLQFEDIIGTSAELRSAVRLAQLTASNNSNVLLQGESGTGKEIFAQAIHNSNCSPGAPFVPLNCGAIPRELIGSELFGYEEGAFTGARKGGKPGKFEQASGGTLFLDEIGDMPLEHQTVLLRVIQEKRMARIGSDKMIPVNVRLICATNKNLLEEVARGTFRLDLFYRLNVMSILIPPLRNRSEDIALLFRYFLDKICRDWNREIAIDPEIWGYLDRYNWPGNVRELQNVVERAANLAESGIIQLQHLPVNIQFPVTAQVQAVSGDYETLPIPISEGRTQRRRIVQESEKFQLLELLNRCGGNITRVAKELGISRKTVYNKMKYYGIEN